MDRVTFEQVRERFPDPVITRTMDDVLRGNIDLYCVGGAFCLATGYDNRFPHPNELSVSFKKYNPHLYHENAEDFAANIVELSDEGRFEEAWAELERAMKY